MDYKVGGHLPLGMTPHHDDPPNFTMDFDATPPHQMTETKMGDASMKRLRSSPHIARIIP